MLTAFLMLAVLHPSWVRVKDGYSVHYRKVVRERDGSDYIIGEYYRLAPGAFIAQCFPGDPLSLSTEGEARAAVDACPVLE